MFTHTHTDKHIEGIHMFCLSEDSCKTLFSPSSFLASRPASLSVCNTIRSLGTYTSQVSCSTYNASL